MLLDTDFLIWCIRGHSKALDWLDAFETIELSVVTHMELMQGTRSKKEMADLEVTLDAWEADILPINEVISMQADELVKHYFHSHAVTLADALIASTALFFNLPLVTANVKHFTPIEGLQLEPFNPEK